MQDELRGDVVRACSGGFGEVLERGKKLGFVDVGDKAARGRMRLGVGGEEAADLGMMRSRVMREDWGEETRENRGRRSRGGRIRGRRHLHFLDPLAVQLLVLLGNTSHSRQEGGQHGHRGKGGEGE